MGTPEFAVPSLRALLQHGYDIPAVITAPDKPSGRGRKLLPPPVKEFSIKHNIPVLQPEKLKDPAFIKELIRISPDLQIVIAFRMLPEVVWSLPPKGTVNLHASLLPQYRGAAPINHALMNGEIKTGLTTFFIDNNIDTGKIILQESVKIRDEDNAGTMHDKLMNLGAKTILKTVNLIESCNVKEISQSRLIANGEILKTAPKISREDCKIIWNKNGREIINFIRGLSPYPTSYSFLCSSSGSKIIVKIFDAVFEESTVSENPGTIITDNRKFLKVVVLNGYINIISIQIQGKKRMDIKSFLSGFRETDQYHFK